MKEPLESKQILLVIVICFFVLAPPAYFHCTDLSGTKFASSALFFENPYQEIGLPDSGEDVLKVFGPTAFFTIFLLGTNLSKESSHLFFRPLSLCQETSILRC
jgi:hypothetical protein